MSRKVSPLYLIPTLVALASCTPEMQKLGSSMLSSTGMISSSQADAVFAAGGKLGKATTPLSEEEEYYLGRGVAAIVLSRYRPVNDPKLLAYINRAGAVAAANSGRPETFGGYHVLVLDSPEINALSAPGGYIFISTGLLRLISNEDELAAVLSHEVGHIALGHGVSAISQANLTEAVTILGKEASQSYGTSQLSELTTLFGDSVKDIADTLLKKGYSRSQEYAADRYSAEILRRAGYSDHALLSMLQSLQSAERTARGGWADTHPNPADRIAEAKGYLRDPGYAPGEELRTKRFNSALRRG